MKKTHPRSSLLPSQLIPKWIFMMATGLIPILFFLLLEGSLRLFHYGEDRSLFRRSNATGVPLLSMNPGVKGRYFTQTDFQPGVSPDAFPETKAPRTLRLFCLGESTTVGYPFWYNAAFPTFLRSYLAEVFPDRKVEVVNLGMTATNSFTVLDVARELVHYSPDAIIVYDGHNEYYGAMGVASREGVTRSRLLTEFTLYLSRFRTYLLLRDGINAVRSLVGHTTGEIDRATLMEKLARGRLIRHSSPIYEEGLEDFKENLRDLSGVCDKADVPLVLCTQVSNLRDLEPFASLHPDYLSDSLGQACDRTIAAGRELLDLREFREAIIPLRLALRIDSGYALAHFLTARACDSLGMYASADSEYRKARDDDAVRFRASGDLNNLIRSFSPKAAIADVESVFAAYSDHGLIGDSLVTEHLHPTVFGQFLIAKEVLAAMERNGILVSPADWRRRDSVDPQMIWQRRPVTALDERIGRRKTAVLRSGWPFVQRPVPLDEIPTSDTLGTIAENVTRGRWDWRHAHEAAALYYAGRSEFVNACAELRSVALVFQRDPEAYKRWARFALRAGLNSEARQALALCQSNSPDAESTKMLGDLMLADGEYEDAEHLYQSALDFVPPLAMQIQIHYARALALLKLRRGNDCIQELHSVLALDPQHRDANALLSQLMQVQGSRP